MRRSLHTNQQNPLLQAKIEDTVCIRRENREECFKKKRITRQHPQQHPLPNHNLSPDHPHPNFIHIYEETFVPAQLNILLQDIASEHPYQLLRSAVGLRKLVCSHQTVHSQVLQKGGLLALLSLMRRAEQPQVVLQASWCLANLAGNQQLDAQLFLDCGLMDLLLSIIEHSQKWDIIIFEHVLIVLGNIGSESVLLRDYLLDSQCITHIINTLMQHPQLPESMVQNACWAISNFCRGRVLPDYPKVAKALRYICCVLIDADHILTDEKILTDCLYVLTHHINVRNNNLEEMEQMGVLKYVINLGKRGCTQGQLVACLRVLGNFAGGPTALSDSMISHGVLDLFNLTLKSSSKSVRCQTCWTLSNLMANPRPTIIPVLQHPDIFNQLMHLLRKDLLTVRKEICYIFTNLVVGMQAEEFSEIVQQAELAENLSELLSCEEENIMLAALQCLELILSWLSKQEDEKYLQRFLKCLERCKGNIWLQSLQQHKSQKINRKANFLLNFYFEVEEQSQDFEPEDSSSSDVLSSQQPAEDESGQPGTENGQKIE